MPKSNIVELFRKHDLKTSNDNEIWGQYRGSIDLYRRITRRETTIHVDLHGQAVRVTALSESSSYL